MRIVIMDDYLAVARDLAPWDSLADVQQLEVIEEHLADEDAVVDAIAAFDVVSIMRERTPFPAELFGRLPNLRLLLTSGMHNAAVDFEAATRHGVIVCGTSGIMTDTPELTWGLLLALARDLAAQDRSVREGRWQTGLGISLHGKRLGLIGLGRIGEKMTRYATAFDMEVVAWSPNLTRQRAEEVGAELVTKDELLSSSDIVSIHLRLGERSRGLIGARELDLMRATALLINTSRGPIIDEAALIDALSKGSIAGAALDVYDTEPIPEHHPLLGLRNTLLAPHLGYATRDGFELYYRETVENIAAFHADSPIRVLNPEVISARA